MDGIIHHPGIIRLGGARLQVYGFAFSLISLQMGSVV